MSSRRGGFGAGRGAACVGFGARPSGRVGGRDQVPQAPDGCGASGAGEEAVVSDAVEAARQHVQEEAADELAGRERHRLDPGLARRLAAGSIVLPAEGDALVVERGSDANSRSRRGGCSGTGRRGRPSVRRTASWRRRPIPIGAAARGRRRRRLCRRAARGRRGRRGVRPHAGPRALRGRGGGTGGRARAPAGRSHACRRSSATRPATGRRRER